MDDDIKTIVNKVFPSDDAKLIMDMLEIVNRDLADTNLTKRGDRLNSLDYLLKGAVK